MKKTLKVLVVVAFMLLMVMALTGCGNKLVATKTLTEEEDFMKGEEKFVIKFKKDKVDSAEWTLEFEDEDTASGWYSLYKLGASEGDPEIKLDGKKLVMTMDTAYFREYADLEDEEMTKEAIKKSLEEEGYTVK